MITAIYLVGRCVGSTIENYKRLTSEGDSIYSMPDLFIALSNMSAKCWNWRTVIDPFSKYRRYSVTITLQIEKCSLSFAHIGPDSP